MKKRVFSREFKLDVVRQWLGGQKRLSQRCREPNLGDTLVRRWREQYELRGEHAWLDSEERDPALQDAEARIAQLEAALGRATLENEFLRHALKTAEKGGLSPRRNGR
jgi:transposase